MSKKKQKKGKRSSIEIIFLGVIIIFIALIFIPKKDNNQISFPDLHGLAFTDDGETLTAAVHDGLREFSNGKWSVPDVPKNDYMGYSAVKDGFYSSGHPGPGSDLKNPLGIIKSTDNGKTADIVDFHGETDFHNLSVGYETEDIYVFNPEKNSKLNDGFYYTNDKAGTWNEMKMTGVTGMPAAIIAHPAKQGQVAIATDKGLYFSTNYGESFELILPEEDVRAAQFSGDNEIIAGTANAKLIRLDLLSGKTSNMTLPDNVDGNITYITSNNNKELAFSTDQLNVYLSKDNGKTWDSIVEAGLARK